MISAKMGEEAAKRRLHAVASAGARKPAKEGGLVVDRPLSRACLVWADVAVRPSWGLCLVGRYAAPLRGRKTQARVSRDCAAVPGHQAHMLRVGRREEKKRRGRKVENRGSAAGICR